MNINLNNLRIEIKRISIQINNKLTRNLSISFKLRQNLQINNINRTKLPLKLKISPIKHIIPCKKNYNLLTNYQNMMIIINFIHINKMTMHKSTIFDSLELSKN